MLEETAIAELRASHREFERVRARLWLDRIRVGLEYRRAMREVEERVIRVRQERDRRVREAVAAGGSYREVARALGLSHSRVQQIVNDRKAAPSRSEGRSP